MSAARQQRVAVDAFMKMPPRLRLEIGDVWPDDYVAPENDILRTDTVIFDDAAVERTRNNLKRCLQHNRELKLKLKELRSIRDDLQFKIAQSDRKLEERVTPRDRTAYTELRSGLQFVKVRSGDTILVTGAKNDQKLCDQIVSALEHHGIGGVNIIVLKDGQTLSSLTDEELKNSRLQRRY